MQPHSEVFLQDPEGLHVLLAGHSHGGEVQERVRGRGWQEGREGREEREERGSPGHGKWKFLAAR